MRTKHGHYKKNVSHLQTLDVYRVLDLFAVTHPALQHAAKKILVAGGRGGKDWAKDVQEAIDSLQRALDMQSEDQPPVQAPAPWYPDASGLWVEFEPGEAVPAHLRGDSLVYVITRRVRDARAVPGGLLVATPASDIAWSYVVAYRLAP